MACMAKQVAQSQDPNLSCPGVASTQPPLVSNGIARIQPQAQCQLFDAPNASSHLISSHFIHIGSSIFLCSLAICPSLSFIGYLKLQIKTIFHTPSLRPYSIGIHPHHVEPTVYTSACRSRQLCLQTDEGNIRSCGGIATPTQVAIMKSIILTISSTWATSSSWN